MKHRICRSLFLKIHLVRISQTFGRHIDGIACALMNPLELLGGRSSHVWSAAAAEQERDQRSGKMELENHTYPTFPQFQCCHTNTTKLRGKATHTGFAIRKKWHGHGGGGGPCPLRDMRELGVSSKASRLCLLVNRMLVTRQLKIRRETWTTPPSLSGELFGCRARGRVSRWSSDDGVVFYCGAVLVEPPLFF